MKVRLAHTLGAQEVRRRLQAHAGEIGSFFPPGLAQVTTNWASPDRMDMRATVVGQTIPGRITVGEDHVVIEMDLPLLLGVMRGPLEVAVRQQATRLLAP